MPELAVQGGTPVRNTLLPYGRQSIDDEDIATVVKVLRSDWLTTGPAVNEFENVFAERVGSKHAVAVSSGTAALHTAAFAAGIYKGDEVIVPAITFAATANCVLYQGGTPVFADVNSDTLLIDPQSVEACITPRTRAVIAVDYAGQPAPYRELQAICDRHGLTLIADASHALGGTCHGKPVGSLAKLNTFSFHPVKHITTGEGGMITTDDAELVRRMRAFRNHGISADHHERRLTGEWFYAMRELGFNYRITDLQCALGLSQLHRLPDWIERRRRIAAQYDYAFSDLEELVPLQTMNNVEHAYHLYVIRLNLENLNCDRNEFFQALRAEGIGVNVHYIPVYLHPYYEKKLGYKPGLCPTAEAAFNRILSLPIFPGMKEEDIEDTIHAVRKVAAAYSRIKASVC